MKAIFDEPIFVEMSGEDLVRVYFPGDVSVTLRKGQYSTKTKTSTRAIVEIVNIELPSPSANMENTEYHSRRVIINYILEFYQLDFLLYDGSLRVIANEPKHEFL